MFLTPRPLGVAVLAIALATLAACSSGSTGSAGDTAVGALDPDADVTITWWTGQNAEAAELLSSLAREYEADHPNVTIEDSSGASTTEGLLTKLSSGFASDSYPDISYAYGSWATELGRSGKTLDITSNVAEPAVEWEAMPSSATATATVDGVVMGFPALVDNLGLIYNQDLFDAAGLDYPTSDWTWDQFRAAAKALTDVENNIFGTAYPVNGSEDTTWRFWPQLWQNGGAILNEDQTEATFNSQAGVDALEFWRQMTHDDGSVYLDQNGERYGPLFYNGAIGMMISGPWVLYDLKQQDVNYGVAYLPGTDGDHQTISGPDLWVLYDHNDAQRAAATYDFISWLTAPEQDVRWNIAYGNLPLRASETESPEYKKYVKTYPGGGDFFANLDNAVQPRPTVAGYVGLSRAVGTAIDEVLLGDADPQEALDKAAAQADIELAG